MYVVLSYSPNYELRCPRGCCSDGSANSRFNLNSFTTLNEVAKHVADFMFQDDCAEYQFMVFDSWKNTICNRYSNDDYLSKDILAIRFPYSYDDYEEEVRYGNLEEELRNLVSSLLTSTKEQAKLLAEEKKRKEEVERVEQERQRKLKQLEHLKKELGQ